METYNFEFERLTGGKELIPTMAPGLYEAILKALALAKVTYDVSPDEMRSVTVTKLGE